MGFEPQEFMAWFDSQATEYNEAMAVAKKGYDDAVALINGGHVDYVQAKAAMDAKFGVKPVEKTTGERGTMPCLLCGGNAHHTKREGLKVNGVSAVRLTFPTGNCTAETPIIVKNDDKGKFPLSKGQLAGLHKDFGVTVTVTKG